MENTIKTKTWWVVEHWVEGICGGVKQTLVWAATAAEAKKDFKEVRRAVKYR